MIRYTCKNTYDEDKGGQSRNCPLRRGAVPILYAKIPIYFTETYFDSVEIPVEMPARLFKRKEVKIVRVSR